MELKDTRPRDWAYLVEFDRKDFSLLMDMAQHIRETHDTDMIEHLNNQFENNSEIIDIGTSILKTKSIRKTKDMVVDVGLRQCINIILGTSSARWSHMAFSGSVSSGIVASNNINIDNWTAGFNILPIATFGWSEPKGMRMLFATILPASFEASGVGSVGVTQINEMGIYNGTAGGPTNDLLNRETFHSNPVIGGIVGDGSSMFSAVRLCSCVIEFCPVA